MRAENEGGGRPLSLFMWGVLAAVFVAAAYLGGSALADQYILPSVLSLPNPTGAPGQATISAAAWIDPGTSVEGTLDDAETTEEWQFRARGGQSATIETWLHPGSGSSTDAELAVRLIAPDGTMLADEVGSAFLLPYVFVPSLPDSGTYRVQVTPVSGTPGRYSIALDLSDASEPRSLAGLFTIPATPATSASTSPPRCGTPSSPSPTGPSPLPNGAAAMATSSSSITPADGALTMPTWTRSRSRRDRRCGRESSWAAQAPRATPPVRTCISRSATMAAPSIPTCISHSNDSVIAGPLT
jgi:hypothetical protein